MKIAFPSRDGMIDGHFGHCEYFTVITVEGDEITREERLEPPSGCGCKSNVVTTLARMGVSVMLAGNMGQGAVQVLASNGIKVYRGCAGTPRDAARQWLSGQVVDSGQSCTEHENCH